MPYEANQSLQICPVPPGNVSEALDLLFSHLQDDERSRQIAAILPELTANKRAGEGLLGAYRNGTLIGSLFFQIQAGRSAQVWMPRLIKNEEPDTAIALLRAAVQRLDNCQVQMAQIMMETVSDEEGQILLAGGFGYLSDLLYLVCQDADFPRAPLRAVLQFEAYNPQNHERLARIVAATYEGTLDCPRLNHVREIEDILAGYRATGEFSPGHWLIVRQEGRDVGCLLLADHPSYENMELVYMGVVPAMRGRGWGADIARHAQWIAAEKRRPRLVLAVDASNSPAIRMYAAVGFRAWDTRRVYYRIFPQKGAGV
jgi:mycothiol synthase